MLLTVFKTHFPCKELYFNISLSKLCVQLVQRKVAPKGLRKTQHASCLVSAPQRQLLPYLLAVSFGICLHISR